jgi:quinate dehydrogenase
VTEGYSTAGLAVPQLIHLKDPDHLRSLDTPYYIVGTVPDFEPHTESEHLARQLLEDTLKRPEKGVLLDMCYKPRFTRHIKLAEQYGWQTVDGVNIIAYQIEEQWMLWAGKQNADKIPVEAARAVLYRAALG